MRLLITTIFGASLAFGVNQDAFEDTKLQPVMDRIEKNADEFDDALESALDDSTLNGSGFEDRLNTWAEFFEDEVDDMAADFKEKDGHEFGRHMGNAMMAAAAINRAMLSRDFSNLSQSRWKAIRDDLNTVASAFAIAPLPNVTVVTFVPATGEMLTRADVRQVMDELEAATDRFTDKFDNAWYTGISGETQKAFFEQAADHLEDAADDVLDEYKEKDAREFQQEFEQALVIAAGMNRMILSSALSQTPAAEWKVVRNHLNTLAGVFGYPVLAETLQPPTVSSR
jgi:hypothetical protein